MHLFSNLKSFFKKLSFITPVVLFLVNLEEERGILLHLSPTKKSKASEKVKSKINLYFSDLNILVIRMILKTSHFKKLGGVVHGV